MWWQVCPLGSLPNLRSLDLSNNLLTSLLDSGLSACGSLEALRVANNRLADPEHAKYFALLPALKVLDVRGNPFAASPKTRCVCAGVGCVEAWVGALLEFGCVFAPCGCSLRLHVCGQACTLPHPTCACLA